MEMGVTTGVKDRLTAFCLELSQVPPLMEVILEIILDEDLQDTLQYQIT